MIIIPENTIRWINRLVAVVIVLMILIVGVVLIVAETIIKERGEHVESINIARQMLKVADDKLADREEHVRYLKEEVKRWEKKSWKTIPSNKKILVED